MAGAAILATMAATVFAGLVFVGAAPAEANTAGNPGVPSAPTTVYSENFENGPSTSPIDRVTAYPSASGVGYTANQQYLQACNGWISSANQDPTASAQVSDCGTQANWNKAQQLAQALGLHNGETLADAANNHVVSAFTAGTDYTAGSVEFATTENIPLAATNRFLAFSVDVAAMSCDAGGTTPPLLQFYLVDDANNAIPQGDQINGCLNPETQDVPAIGDSGTSTIHTGTYLTSTAALYAGSSVGIKMENMSGTGYGNDHAFDNIKVLDQTPQLDKAFSPKIVRVGSSSTLTFTVTNTTDLNAKNGWSFTDNLPSGLTVASPSDSSTTCTSGALTAAPGTSTVSATGNLDAGQASCTFSVNVTSPVTGTFTNGAGNINPLTGLDRPSDSTVQFVDPSLQTTKTANTTTAATGQTITYTIAMKNTGTASFTADRPATFTDDLTQVLDDATYNDDATSGATYSDPTLSWSGPLAPGATSTITYSVTVLPIDTGDRNLDNTVVTPSGDMGNCSAASSDSACSVLLSVPAPPAVSSVSTTDRLPHTGADGVGPASLLAGVLLLFGLGLLIIRRRNRSRDA